MGKAAPQKESSIKLADPITQAKNQTQSPPRWQVHRRGTWTKALEREAHRERPPRTTPCLPPPAQPQGLRSPASPLRQEDPFFPTGQRTYRHWQLRVSLRKSDPTVWPREGQPSVSSVLGNAPPNSARTKQSLTLKSDSQGPSHIWEILQFER